ncbi:MAG: DUF3037 domain-containing protein [Burkholderiales bacterium]
MENLCKFSVLRFIPDKVRDESVNIGIALFVDSDVQFHLSRSLSKAQSLHPGLSLAELASIPADLPAFLAPLASAEEKHRALQRFGPISATPLGDVVLAPGESYDEVVERLMRIYVYAPRTRQLPDPSKSALRETIASTFRNLGIYSTAIADINDHKVVSRFPVSSRGDLLADFAFKNGHMRLAQVVDFRVTPNSMVTKLAESCRKAVTLDQARRHLSPDVERFVIYALPDEIDDSIIDSSLGVLSDYSDVILNAHSEIDLNKFSSTFAQAMPTV